MPYAITADWHCRNWKQFATDTEFGNSRLIDTLTEIERMAKILRDAGGDTVFVAGDIFHDRDSISPTVFNALSATLARCKKKYGVSFVMMDGNHDLSSRDSNELSSAVSMLRYNEGVKSCVHGPVFFKGHGVAMVPWYESRETFLEKVDELKRNMASFGEDYSKYVLLCHVGIDGVLSGVPGHFSQAQLSGLGFSRIFSGHYHHYETFGDVTSVGSLTHQTWSDVGTKSGFIIFDEAYQDWVYYPSKAPNFVDYDASTPLSEYSTEYWNCFVRVRNLALEEKEISELRDHLMSNGAKGVVFSIPPKSAISRSGVASTASPTIEKSIEEWVISKHPSNPLPIINSSNEILRKVKS